MAKAMMSDVGGGGGVSKFVVDDGKLSEMNIEISRVSGLLAQYNQDIYSKIAEMSSAWNGPSYDAFVEKAESYRKEIEELPVLFNLYAEKVGVFSDSASLLIKDIAQLLDFSTSIASYGIDYTLQNIDKREYYAAAYRLEPAKDATAKQIRKEAEQIYTNLWADIETLNAELINITISQETLTTMLNEGRISQDLYDSSMMQLELQKSEVEVCLLDYTNAYNAVSPLFVDKIFGYGTDGAFVEASDWWGNDTATALAAASQLNEALGTLDPVAAYCETSSLNGRLALDTSNDYALSSFYNGPNVSNVVMNASYTAAVDSGETMTLPTNPNVTLFNSEANLRAGMEASGYVFGTGTYTFSQVDAYSDYSPYSSYEGYDSVAIKNGDSVTYMTYNQYVMSTHNDQRLNLEE